MVALVWYTNLLLAMKLLLQIDNFFIICENDRVIHDKNDEIVKLLKALNRHYVLTTVMNLTELQTNLQFNFDIVDRFYFILVDINDETKAFLKEVLSMNSRTIYTKWLVLTEQQIDLEEYFKDFYIPFPCVFQITDWKNEERVDIKEMYRVARDTPLVTSYVLTWTFEQGLVDRDSLALYGTEEFNLFVASFIHELNEGYDNIYKRRPTLNGHVVNVSTFEAEPFIILDNLKNPKRVTGHYGYVWSEMESVLNFSSRYIRKLPHSNELLFGMNNVIKSLTDQTAEVGLQSLTMDAKYQGKIDYSERLSVTKRVLVVKRTSLEIKWNSFLAPFCKTIWITIIGIYFLSCLLLYFIHEITDDVSSPDNYFSFRETLMNLLAQLCNQGISPVPKRTSKRVIFVVIGITAVIMNASYAAALVSSLTNQVYVKPFQSLNQLLQLGTYTLGVVNMSYQYTYISETDDELFRNIRDKILERENLPKHDKEGFLRVCDNERFVFLTTTAALDYFQSTLPCKVVSVDTQMSSMNTIAFAKGFPYKGIIRTRIIMMRENGMLVRATTIREKINRVCEVEEIKRVNIYSVIPLLFAFSCGLTLAFSGLLIELLWKRKQGLRKLRKALRK